MKATGQWQGRNADMTAGAKQARTATPLSMAAPGRAALHVHICP
jgi:hypothetical protein